MTTATTHVPHFHRSPAIASLAALLALSLAACGPKPPASDTAPPASADATAPSAGEPAAPPAEAANPPAVATTPEPPAPGEAAAQCKAEAAQAFVGKEATDATVADAKAAAGAKGDVRVIKPGQPVTMDYRADRLNVEVDERKAIVRITCG